MALILVLMVLVLMAGGFGAWVYRQQITPFGHFDGIGRFVMVERGDTKDIIARKLVAAGALARPEPFLVFVAWKGPLLQAGEYHFDAPATPLEIIEKMARGRVYQHAVTIPEGLTLAETADLVAQSGLVNREALLKEMLSGELIQDLDASARNLEGYLFPDTYRFPRGVAPGEVVKRMVRRFREVFDAAHVNQALSQDLTVRQAVTLASLVEKETGLLAERPLISDVFLNRLRKGMRLQCDPTIIYGLTLEGRYRGRLDYAALQSDTPYNTYRYAGLPPGPIANPGKASLEAAINPAGGALLYFVSQNNGSHHFSHTLAEHNRAVRKFQRRLSSSR